MTTIIKNTYGKTRNYVKIEELPKVGDEWNWIGYHDAIVKNVVPMNDTVAETTSGDPKEQFDFYKIVIEMEDDDFSEYVAIEGGYGII